MDFRDFLDLMRRRAGILLLAMLIFLGLGLGYTSQQSEERSVMIFLTMGARLPEGASVGQYAASQNENIVDQFTQTVQGWLAHPSFATRVSEHLLYPVGLSVRKQEKQNLLVTVNLPDSVEAKTTYEAVIATLRDELNAYNEVANTSFVLALSSFSEFEISPQWGLNALVALMLGWLTGIFFVVAREYMQRTISFAFQVEDILEGPPLMRLSSSPSAADLRGLLALYAARMNGKWTILEMGESGLLHHRTLLKEHHADLLMYPEDLKQPIHTPIVIAVRLGVTSENALREVRLLSGQTLSYILIV